MAKLDQPPYGDRAVVLTDTGTLIGATGVVPCLFPLEVLRHFRDADERPERVSSTPEFSVFYSLGETFRVKRSYEIKNGMLGVYIHNQKIPNGKTDAKGRNPFDNWHVPVEGRKVYFSSLYPTYDWVLDNGYANLGVWV